MSQTAQDYCTCTPHACAEPDPDITGIGVTIAVFVQAFFNIVASAFAAHDGNIDEDEAKKISGLSRESFILAAGLVITSFIRLCQKNLSAYHALMVLQMTWALEGPLLTSYFPVDLIIEYYRKEERPKEERSKEEQPNELPPNESPPNESPPNESPPIKSANGLFDAKNPGQMGFSLYIFRLVHGICAVIVWTIITTRPTWLQCSDETFLWTGWFVTEPTPKFLFLVLSIIRVVEAFVSIWCTRRTWMNGVKGQKKIHVPIVETKIAAALILEIFAAIWTVWVITKSAEEKVVPPGESKFGFGQILALVLLGLRAWDLVTDVKRKWKVSILRISLFCCAE